MNTYEIAGWSFFIERPEANPVLTFTTAYGMAFEAELYENVVALNLLSPCCVELLDVTVDFNESGDEGNAMLVCEGCQEIQTYTDWSLRGAWSSGERLPDFFLSAVEDHCNPLKAGWEQGTLTVLLEKLQSIFTQSGLPGVESVFLNEMQELLSQDAA